MLWRKERVGDIITILNEIVKVGLIEIVTLIRDLKEVTVLSLSYNT